MSAAFTHSQQSHFTNDNKTNPQGTTTQASAQPSEAQPQEPHELIADRPPEKENETMPTPEPAAKPRRPRGFAAMDRKLVSEIARKGGKAAHSAGTAHEFTTEEARVAGRKGGRATHAKRRAGQSDMASDVTGNVESSTTTTTTTTDTTSIGEETSPTERH